MVDINKELKTESFDLKELTSKVESGQIEYITIYLTSICQVYSRRVDAVYFLKNIVKEGLKFPIMNSQMSSNNDIITTKHINLNNLVDITAYPDLNSGFRIMSWLGNNHAACFGITKNHLGESQRIFSRDFLLDLLEKTEKKYGLTFKHGPELEYYLFNSQVTTITKQFEKTTLKDFAYSENNSDYSISLINDRQESFNEKLKKNLKNAGIPLELVFCEHGPGQQEINIRYDDSLNSADNHVLLKQCTKYTAFSNGLGASFMAKPYSEYDGCSAHIHISCYKNGNSIFSPSENEEENYIIDVSDNRKIKCSKMMMHFIGGLCKHMHEMFLVFATNVNSYKRFKVNSFAPIHSNSWCYDSRTCGIRICGEGKSIHLEVRFAGADANPYMLPAIIIAAGLEGIENKIEPPSINKGNLYESKDDSLILCPTNILDAIKNFEKSDFCKKILGEEIFDYYIELGKTEWNLYNDHISSYEIKRFIDLV